MSPPPFVDEITGPEAQPDGTELFRTSLIPSPGNDLSIPLGTWTLLLLPIDAAGTARIPVRMFFNGPAQPNPGEFRRIEADLARFELISDPNDLVPADLVADPYVHLVPNPALAPVRLIGPGLTIILRGEGLTDVSADFTGANGGSDERFPSARFSPPHFLIGATNNFIGIACDEVMLDLSTEIDPDNLDDLTGIPGDGSFEGLILQELGIFIGDPNEVGTWSGMTRVHNFVLRFDPVEVTGTFEGELVTCSCPRRPAGRYRRQLGDRLRASASTSTRSTRLSQPQLPRRLSAGCGWSPLPTGRRWDSRLPGRSRRQNRRRFRSRTPDESTNLISGGCGSSLALTHSPSW